MTYNRHNSCSLWGRLGGALLIASLSMLASCEDKKGKELEALMEEIRTDYAEGRDSDCLVAIDTLRARFPKSVAARREALGLYQEASLRIAQKELAKTDSALTIESARYAEMQKTVGQHKAEGKATADELTGLTVQRMLRDSLQTQFDVLCAKIKYIHKRQKQL